MSDSMHFPYSRQMCCVGAETTRRLGVHNIRDTLLQMDTQRACLFRRVCILRITSSLQSVPKQYHVVNYKTMYTHTHGYCERYLVDVYVALGLL